MARLGFIGFGEAARAFCDSLRTSDSDMQFAAYDIKLDGIEAIEMRAAMTARNVTVAETARALADQADWIFSAVTADQSLIAVQALVPGIRQGQVVIDINSVSPARKRNCAALINAAQGRYLDMAVMAPVHLRGHSTPVLIAGEPAADILCDLDTLGFVVRQVGDAPGAATAIKMVRSLFVKGLEAITVETLLAAQASECFDEIVASLSTSYPGLNWSDFPTYQFERTLKHGARRAAEMHESAATLNDLGLNGALATEIANTQALQGDAGRAATIEFDDLDQTVRAVLPLRIA